MCVLLANRSGRCNCGSAEGKQGVEVFLVRVRIVFRCFKYARLGRKLYLAYQIPETIKADKTFAQVFVAVFAGAQGRFGVIHVQAFHVFSAYKFIKIFQHFIYTRSACHVKAGTQSVRRVQADAYAVFVL